MLEVASSESTFANNLANKMYIDWSVCLFMGVGNN